MAKTATSPPALRTRRTRPVRRTGTMVFTRRNYLLLLIGVGLVVLGYTLMRIENEVDGVLSLYVAPLMILGGYLEVIYAILWRPKTSSPHSPD